MPADDYASAGGRLKLKGAPPSSSSGDKKKKRKKRKLDENDIKEGTPDATAVTKREKSESGSEGKAKKEQEDRDVRGKSEDSVKDRDGDKEDTEGDKETVYYKTEAERRFEERKRRRLDERLKKEGIRSHKERVEEFNKYLANLSEHHDMPRIGPG